jgi:hypothetical protein
LACASAVLREEVMIEFEVVLACNRCGERRKLTAHFTAHESPNGGGGHALAVEFKSKPDDWKVCADGKVVCPAHRDV